MSEDREARRDRDDPHWYDEVPGRHTAGPVWMNPAAITPDWVSELVLERIRIGADRRIGRYTLDSLRTERGSWVINETADSLMVSLRGELLAHKVAESHVTGVKPLQVPIPASWWQMFKHEYRSRRWMRPILRRWPIQMTMFVRYAQMTVDISHYNRFPEANVPYGRDLGQPYPYTTATPDMVFYTRPPNHKIDEVQDTSTLPGYEAE